MKNAVILATAVVAAVILIQGAAPAVIVTPARASSDIVAGSAESASSIAAFTQSLTGKTSTAATGSTKAETTSSGTAAAQATTVAATVTATTVAATVAATTASSGTAGRVYTTTPAPVTSVATPPPTQPTAPTCPSAIGGSTAGAPGASDASGIPGTSSADIASFAAQYNAIRVANCLQPVPYANIRYSSCLQQRLWWMADDPSTNSASAWGHTGTAVRSDGVPIVGCDGDLAGGSGYTGATVASAWWGSPDHRASLYQPPYAGSFAGICIGFAVTHGGVNVPAPNEPASFVRAAAYWYGC